MTGIPSTVATTTPDVPDAIVHGDGNGDSVGLHALDTGVVMRSGQEAHDNDHRKYNQSSSAGEKPELPANTDYHGASKSGAVIVKGRPLTGRLPEVRFLNRFDFFVFRVGHVISRNWLGDGTLGQDA
jgi:hypothetical protein